MTPTTAKRWVIVSVGGAAILTAVGEYRAGRSPSVRIGVGAVAVAVILTVMAEVLPDLAAALALLMLVTAAFVVGRAGWEAISAASRITPMEGTA